jgi:hypothetical protein
VTTRLLTFTVPAVAAAAVLTACTSGGDTTAQQSAQQSAQQTTAPVTSGAVSASASVSATGAAPAPTRAPAVVPEPEIPGAHATEDVTQVDPCDPGTVAAASPDGWTPLYCGGGWARVALPQSDGMKLLRWDGTGWHDVEPAGETMTGFRCYDRAGLVTEGAPEELFGNITVC